MTLTPHELRLAERRRDAHLDCIPAELEGRRAQREADRRWRESVRQHHRYMDLSPVSKAAKQLEADFEADDPPFDLAMAFARDHADKKRRGEEVSFHWASLARDLHQRYGPVQGRALYDAGLSGYPPPGHPRAHDDHWNAIGRRLDEWAYSDESIVSRIRAFCERPLSAAHRWLKDYAAHATQHPEWERSSDIATLESRTAEIRNYDVMLAYIRWVDANDERDRITAEQDDFWETVKATAKSIEETVNRRCKGLEA